MQADEPLFLGVDIGTYGTKGCLVSYSGRIIATAYIETPLPTISGEYAEEWPDLWLNACLQTIKDILKLSKINPSDIGGISISGFAPACVFVDKQFVPVRPAIIWIDRRAVKETKSIKEKIGEKEIFEKTGNVIDPYFGFTKILWVKNNEPNIWGKVHKILTIQGYVVHKLTGINCIDHSSAGNIGGIYNIHKRSWDEGLMDELQIPRDFFPRED